MTVSTQNLAIALVGPDGQPLSQAEVNISVVESGVAITAHVGRVIYTVYTDKDGLASVDLVPNSVITPSQWYLCEVIQEPKGRKIVLYTVGFVMPDHDTNLHDIATVPGVSIIADTVAAAGFNEHETTELWSEGCTVGTGIVTKDTITGSYGETGFVANQNIINGYAEVELTVPVQVDAAIGLTVQSSDVNELADLAVAHIELVADGSLNFTVEDTIAFSNTYVADDELKIVSAAGNMYLYKNGTLLHTEAMSAPGLLTRPWYFAAAIKTNTAVIENMKLNGDAIDV